MSTNDGHIVYCAGPMFSPGDFFEMGNIAAALEKAGYATYLPQRDGIEVAKVMDSMGGGGSELPAGTERVTALMREAVFSLDVFQLLSRCDSAVFNMNGRVPDEGSVAETSMAVAAGKPIVIYKNDPITILMGQDNPLVQGLSYTWTYANSYDLIPKKLTTFRDLYERTWGAPPEPNFSGYIQGAIDLGALVWAQMLSLREQFPDDSVKVTLAVVGWIMKPENQAAFDKAFPKPRGAFVGASF